MQFYCSESEVEPEFSGKSVNPSLASSHHLDGSNAPIKNIFSSFVTDVNAQADDGSTALHQASFLGLEAIVQSLLYLEADVSIPDNLGFTSLHLATQGGHVECIRALLEVGNADMWAENIDGFTPVTNIMAILWPDDDADVKHKHDSEKKAALFEILWEYRVSPDGMTLLMCAASYGKADWVHKLLELNVCDINATDKHGFTALMIALLPSGDNRDTDEWSDKTQVIELLRGNRTYPELLTLYFRLGSDS